MLWAATGRNIRRMILTDKEIYEAVQRYAASMPLPKWAADATTEEKEEYERAIENGITDGTSPMTLVPRYQAAVMANRAYELTLGAKLQ